MKYDQYNTPWRLVANTIFGPPKSGKLYGTMDIDITETEKYIWSERKEKRKITITSIVIAAIAGFFGFIAIVGVLAAIAIPNFVAYRNKTFQHSIKSELHNLLAAELSYFAEHNIYSTNLEDLNFLPVSQDITIEIISADQNCFEALGMHNLLTDSLSVDCNGFKVLQS